MPSSIAAATLKVTKKLDALPVSERRGSKYAHVLDGEPYLLDFATKDERRRTIASLRSVAHRRGLSLKARQVTSDDGGICAAVQVHPRREAA